MSLGEEAKAEFYIDYVLQYGAVEREAETGIWETKDGRRLHVSEMTDSHLQNTIRMLERKNIYDIYMPWIHVMKAELKRRGVEVDD